MTENDCQRLYNTGSYYLRANSIDGELGRCHPQRRGAIGRDGDRLRKAMHQCKNEIWDTSDSLGMRQRLLAVNGIGHLMFMTSVSVHL